LILLVHIETKLFVDRKGRLVCIAIRGIWYCTLHGFGRHWVYRDRTCELS